MKAKRRQTFISIISLISLGGVALGVTAMIVVLGVMTGFEDGLKKKILGVNSHIIVVRYGDPMDNYLKLIPIVKESKDVTYVEPFIYSQVMVNTYGGITGGILRGVDTKLAGPAMKRFIREGSLDDLNGPEATVILGIEMAKQMGVEIGDTIKVISPNGNVTPMGGRSPREEHFKVAGLFESGMYDYDTTMIYMSLGRAQDFLSMEGSVTGLEVKVDDIYGADRVRESIIAALGSGYWAKDWMQMNSNLFSALKLEKVAMFVILTLTVLVAAFNIISTLTMVVMEKTKEIAILKSMGATRFMVMKVFMFQGLFIGILGTILGLIGGLLLCGLLSEYQFINLPEKVYYITKLPVLVKGFDVFLITLSAVIISFLATLYPAWQASRLNPVEALRYE